jgi:hypothetical protein
MGGSSSPQEPTGDTHYRFVGSSATGEDARRLDCALNGTGRAASRRARSRPGGRHRRLPCARCTRPSGSPSHDWRLRHGRPKRLYVRHRRRAVDPAARGAARHREEADAVPARDDEPAPARGRAAEHPPRQRSRDAADRPSDEGRVRSLHRHPDEPALLRQDGPDEGDLVLRTSIARRAQNVSTVASDGRSSSSASTSSVRFRRRPRSTSSSPNPPFGGEEEKGIQKNFPEATQTAETALLFLQFIQRSLKPGGRCQDQAAEVRRVRAASGMVGEPGRERPCLASPDRRHRRRRLQHRPRQPEPARRLRPCCARRTGRPDPRSRRGACCAPARAPNRGQGGTGGARLVPIVEEVRTGTDVPLAEPIVAPAEQQPFE